MKDVHLKNIYDRLGRIEDILLDLVNHKGKMQNHAKTVAKTTAIVVSVAVSVLTAALQFFL